MNGTSKALPWHRILSKTLLLMPLAFDKNDEEKNADPPEAYKAEKVVVGDC
jgi:hypothetical protein